MKRAVLALVAVLVMLVSSVYAQETKKISPEAKVFLGAMAYLSDEALLDIRPPAPDNINAVAYCQESKAEGGFITVAGTAIDMGPIYRNISLPVLCLHLYRAGNQMDANDMRRLAILAWRNVRGSQPDLQYVYAAEWLGRYAEDNAYDGPNDHGFLSNFKFLGYFKSTKEAEVLKDPALDKFVTEIALGQVGNALKTLRSNVSNEEVNRVSHIMNRIKTNLIPYGFEIEGKPLAFVARNYELVNADFPPAFKFLPETPKDGKPVAKQAKQKAKQ